MNSYIQKLAGGQKKSGGFADPDNIESVFYTSLILCCLGRLREISEIRIIKQKAAGFLLSQKNKDWLFSKNANIDFCALSALNAYNDKIINAEAAARILKNLISLESKEGGPYYSYFGDNREGTGKNIDLATNSIIAGFLYSLEVELPNITDLIELAVEKNDFMSDFYASGYPVIYFISRFYQGAGKDKLIGFILAERNKEMHWGNPLNAAMAVSALLSLGYPAEKIGDELGYLKKISEDELCAPYPLGKNSYSTAELNIAFYIEALENYNEKKDRTESMKRSEVQMIVWDKKEKEMFEKILNLAKERFSDLPAGIKDIALGEIQKTMKGNLDKQMSLMPFWFKNALGKKADKIPDDLVVCLGLMNVFFWTAFIIYDDFWDEEGTPKILPTANLYARDFIGFFDRMFADGSEFNIFFHDLMDRLDSGNTEILIKFRSEAEGGKVKIPDNIPDYGDYEIVYEPSSAHILGPVAMLYEFGYEIETEEVRNLIGYFRNYLIAMQINDDIYDWEDDLKRGHLSTVVVMLLRDFDRKGKGIDMVRDSDELKKVFWFKTLPKACKIAIEHTERSRQFLKKLSILEAPAPLENLVNAIESSAKNALREQKYTSDFLKAYKS